MTLPKAPVKPGIEAIPRDVNQIILTLDGRPSASQKTVQFYTGFTPIIPYNRDILIPVVVAYLQDLISRAPNAKSLLPDHYYYIVMRRRASGVWSITADLLHYPSSMIGEVEEVRTVQRMDLGEYRPD